MNESCWAPGRHFTNNNLPYVRGVVVKKMNFKGCFSLSFVYLWVENSTILNPLVGHVTLPKDNNFSSHPLFPM